MINSFRRVAGCRPGSVFLYNPKIETGHAIRSVSARNIFLNYVPGDEKHWQYEEF
jgi:hypothetical protein